MFAIVQLPPLVAGHSRWSASARVLQCLSCFERPTYGPKETEEVAWDGTVEKVIKPLVPNQAEKAQIGIHGADDLYREIRIDNVVADESGTKAQLKPGTEIDVIVEADSYATLEKPENS